MQLLLHNIVDDECVRVVVSVGYGGKSNKSLKTVPATKKLKFDFFLVCEKFPARFGHFLRIKSVKMS